MPEPEVTDKYISILKFGSDANAKSYYVKDEQAQRDINDLNTTIKRIKDEIGLVDAGQEQSVSSLQSRVEILEQSLADQQNPAVEDSLAAQITAVDTALGTAQQQLATKTALNTLSGTVTSHGIRLDTAEQGLSTLQTNVANIAVPTQNDIEDVINNSSLHDIVLTIRNATLPQYAQEISALKTQVNDSLDSNDNLTLKGTVVNNTNRIVSLEQNTSVISELNFITLFLKNASKYMIEHWPSKNINGTLNWSAGGIDPSDGTFNSTSNTLRTENYISLSDIIKVLPANNYQFQIYFYLYIDGQYVYDDTQYDTQGEVYWFDKNEYLLSCLSYEGDTPPTNEYCRLIVQAKDQSAVTASSIDDYIKVYAPITDDDIASLLT